MEIRGLRNTDAHCANYRGHDPNKWHEFQRRYRAELGRNPPGWQELIDAAAEGDVTLLFSARDTEHNSAVILRKFLQARVGRGAKRA